MMVCPAATGETIWLVNPPAKLRSALAEGRSSGSSFRGAWASALTSALRGTDEATEWAQTFGETRAAWESAYERSAAPKSHRALAVVGQDPEREVAIETPGDRVCPMCGGRAHRGQAVERDLLRPGLPAGGSRPRGVTEGERGQG